LSSKPRGRKPEGLAYMRYVFGYYEKNAKIRGINFELNFDDFCKITQQNCFYCGATPVQGNNKSRLNRPNVFNGIVKHNGIDRINNTLGYAVNNSVPCCKTCNYAKRQMPQLEFYTWVKRVYEYRVSSVLKD
jgi:hypothetical protein